MNYWWNTNLSGIWTTCIWTYSPYLCTGILPAFFNFSLDFEYTAGASHFVSICWICITTIVCIKGFEFIVTTVWNSPAHNHIQFSFILPALLKKVESVTGVHCRGAQAGGMGIIWEEVCGLLSIGLTALCDRKDFCHNSHLQGSDWSSSCSSEIAGAIDKVAALISKYQQPLRNFQMKYYPPCSTY